MVSVAVLTNGVCDFFFSSLLACFVGWFGFFFFCECQSPAVCCGNSVVGGCCAPKGLRVRKEGTYFLLVICPDIKGKQYQKATFLS